MPLKRILASSRNYSCPGRDAAPAGVDDFERSLIMDAMLVEYYFDENNKRHEMTYCRSSEELRDVVHVGNGLHVLRTRDNITFLFKTWLPQRLR